MTDQVYFTVAVRHITPYAPQYQSRFSAGSDLQADISEAITIEPMQRRIIPTGIILALPSHLEAQIRPRSGLSSKFGITVVNAPGTIDPDYRGEIKVPVINLSTEAYTIHPGDRIAQMVITPFVRAVFEEVLFDRLPSSDRGAHGFGSTGL